MLKVRDNRDDIDEDVRDGGDLLSASEMSDDEIRGEGI